MVLSNAYNYINVLDKAADASWTRNDVLANNIANADTPGYKRKDVQFETYLSNAVAGTDSLDETVANLDLNDLNATVYNEQPGLSYRSDGNNVDVSTENVELAKNQIKYYTLMIWGFGCERYRFDGAAASNGYNFGKYCQCKHDSCKRWQTI